MGTRTTTSQGNLPSTLHSNRVIRAIVLHIEEFPVRVMPESEFRKAMFDKAAWIPIAEPVRSVTEIGGIRLTESVPGTPCRANSKRLVFITDPSITSLLRWPCYDSDSVPVT